MLTNQQKLDLHIQHDIAHDERIRDCIKAVIHASNNWSPVEIADVLLIYETKIRKHIKDYTDHFTAIK